MSATQNNSVQIAESEANKIFNGLHLFTFESEKKMVLVKFSLIQPKFHENFKYWNPKLLIPIVIYLCFLLFGHKINKSDLLAVSTISRADFNNFILQLKRYLTRETRN